VEALFLVEALLLRGVVAGELRLRDPLELKGHVLELLSLASLARLAFAPAAAGDEKTREDGEPREPQPAPSHPASTPFRVDDPGIRTAPFWHRTHSEWKS